VALLVIDPRYEGIPGVAHGGYLAGRKELSTSGRYSLGTSTPSGKGYQRDTECHLAFATPGVFDQERNEAFRPHRELVASLTSL
jgi:hypothetical protein